MEKILTIIVPIYNMAKYLRAGLDSYLAVKRRWLLSLTLIDNSSEDESFDIAKEYESKSQGLFCAIRKPNGGYGSSVNLGIELAKTKYLKVVDADDSVNPEALDELLERLLSCDDDAILTPHLEIFEKSGEAKAVFYNFPDGAEIPISSFRYSPGFHGLCFKTEFLKKASVTLSENAYFADEELAVYPFFYLKSIRYFDIAVYRYSREREGQSTSEENVIKRLSDRERVLKRMADFYEAASIRPKNRAYALKRVAKSLGNHFTTLLILHPKRAEGRREARRFKEYLRRRHPSLYRATRGKRRALLLLNLLGTSPSLYERLKKILLRNI